MMDDSEFVTGRCRRAAHHRLARFLSLLCFVGIVGLSTGCVDADDTDSSWSYVYTTVIQPNCTTSNCHSALGSTAGLQFHTLEGAYFYLTGKSCVDPGLPGEADHNFVVPYEPERSKLLYQLRGEETWRMPPDVALPEVEIELVERWILEGASCD